MTIQHLDMLAPHVLGEGDILVTRNNMDMCTLTLLHSLLLFKNQVFSEYNNFISSTQSQPSWQNK